MYCTAVYEKTFRLLILGHTILTIELVNTSASLDGLLLSGIERMALRTNLNMDIFLGGTSHELVPAVTYNLCLIILWMDSLTHITFTSSKLISMPSVRHLLYTNYNHNRNACSHLSAVIIPVNLNSFSIITQAPLRCKNYF